MFPQQNIRILITRSRSQNSGLAAALEVLGAIPILIPAIEIAPPENYDLLDTALAEIESFDWLLFTSANAVEIFEQRRNPSLTPRKIAVIGPATARAVQGIGLKVDLLPPRFVAESLAEAIVPEVSGRKVLLIRAAEARDVLPEALVAAGAEVTIAPAYRTRIPLASIAAVQRLFSAAEELPDAVTFTSASTARNLIDLLEAANLTLPRGIALASIGPITSQALRELGYAPTMEAAEPTIPSLIEALENYFLGKEG